MSIDKDANIEHAVTGKIPSMLLTSEYNNSDTVFLLISAPSRYLFTFKAIGGTFLKRRRLLFQNKEKLLKFTITLRKIPLKRLISMLV